MGKVYCFNPWCSDDLRKGTTAVDEGSTGKDKRDFETIIGSHFEHLLDLCFEDATAFSMQKGLWQNATDVSLEQELAPYEIRTIYTKKWFLWDLRDVPEEDSWTMCQKMYRATKEAKEILKVYFNEIFLGYTKDERDLKNYTLEDLCFFQGEKLFVGTKSHESRLYVYPPSEAFEQEIMKLGVWEDASAYAKEFYIGE
ncbi:MAG: hypothetical protein J6J38_10115 [Lachnospiraceae bacterium]|nr:hypothetical protein [Lachnospiraceae bacterium]